MSEGTATGAVAVQSYFDNSGRDDLLSGGVKMIPITTPRGTFRVWTKRVGNNPRVKVLLLHGGPGATHEYFEAVDSYFPAAGIEYYFYDRLGSAYSDQPDFDDLWELPRFVDEVDQVRQALGLQRENFYVLGHSYLLARQGGISLQEFARRFSQEILPLLQEYAYEDYDTRAKTRPNTSLAPVRRESHPAT
jgi:proline iminopeptidase